MEQLDQYYKVVAVKPFFKRVKPLVLNDNTNTNTNTTGVILGGCIFTYGETTLINVGGGVYRISDIIGGNSMEEHKKVVII